MERFFPAGLHPSCRSSLDLVPKHPFNSECLLPMRFLINLKFGRPQPPLRPLGTLRHHAHQGNKKELPRGCPRPHPLPGRVLWRITVVKQGSVFPHRRRFLRPPTLFLPLQGTTPSTSPFVANTSTPRFPAEMCLVGSFFLPFFLPDPPLPPPF